MTQNAAFLQKRTVLITGAAAGLMRGVALAFARERYCVALTYRPGGTPPEATLALLRSEGFDAAAFPVDFLRPAHDVAEALAAITGELAIDVLVHGVGPMRIARFENSAMEDYDVMVDGNLRSAVQAAVAVLPGMRSRTFGRLIFFALSGSQWTQPVRGLAVHAAAKAGVVAFARSLALEEGKHHITVNVVAPGDIRDKERSRDAARGHRAANPVTRPGTWEDVADAVLFAARDDADFISGAVLNVSGGLSEPYERNAERE
ncbi:MAG: SDR family NAD(P)-dependent oxidoreductase [Vulcanimicrobiaceae bacterium]